MRVVPDVGAVCRFEHDRKHLVVATIWHGKGRAILGGFVCLRECVRELWVRLDGSPPLSGAIFEVVDELLLAC